MASLSEPPSTLQIRSVRVSGVDRPLARAIVQRIVGSIPNCPSNINLDVVSQGTNIYVIVPPLDYISLRERLLKASATLPSIKLELCSTSSSLGECIAYALINCLDTNSIEQLTNLGAVHALRHALQDVAFQVNLPESLQPYACFAPICNERAGAIIDNIMKEVAICGSGAMEALLSSWPALFSGILLPLYFTSKDHSTPISSAELVCENIKITSAPGIAAFRAVFDVARTCAIAIMDALWNKGPEYDTGPATECLLQYLKLVRICIGRRSNGPDFDIDELADLLFDIGCNAMPPLYKLAVALEGRGGNFTMLVRFIYGIALALLRIPVSRISTATFVGSVIFRVLAPTTALCDQLSLDKNVRIVLLRQAAQIFVISELARETASELASNFEKNMICLLNDSDGSYREEIQRVASVIREKSLYKFKRLADAILPKSPPIISTSKDSPAESQPGGKKKPAAWASQPTAPKRSSAPEVAKKASAKQSPQYSKPPTPPSAIQAKLEPRSEIDSKKSTPKQSSGGLEVVSGSTAPPSYASVAAKSASDKEEGGCSIC